ncbi:MAG: 50S ribosome-binding GTPase [Elusimicrobiota bacterium]|jgi:small GTP-binding protein|nr:50S ribosome-binding GTPase [Elusimicrobiota bacterium]
MERLYIGIYGGVNSGKSTLINRLAGQDIAIVAPQAGTTTDPVRKNIELEGVGPAVLIDTAGYGDDTALAARRAAKTAQTLDIVDMAVVLSAAAPTPQDTAFIETLKQRKIPFFIINKEQAQDRRAVLRLIQKNKPAHISAKQVLLDDIVAAGDIVVLVTPIDAAAPQGRLILPQAQSIRNLLDNNAVSVVLQPRQLAGFLAQNKNVKLVVTDSQAFGEVNKIVPADIALTSFSILFARLKGNFELYLKSAGAIDKLKDGDKVLMLESCAHSAGACDDIGRVKLPALLSKKTGKKLEFSIVSGLDALPVNLREYALIIQCGGCMVTKQQLKTRIEAAAAAGAPVTNYGVAMAYCAGILPRVTEVFKKGI